MSDPGHVWASFTLDPRRPEHAALRASDADRNVVHQVLADAYADGRLDHEEFESRTVAVGQAKTLGELPGLVEGLIPLSAVPAPRARYGLLSNEQIQRRAVQAWQRSRREALWAMLSISAVCWAIWAFFGQGFQWPWFVMLATSLNLLKTQVRRADMIADEQRRLERKQQREIDKRRRKGLPE
jgi:hypothetical protein